MSQTCCQSIGIHQKSSPKRGHMHEGFPQEGSQTVLLSLITRGNDFSVSEATGKRNFNEFETVTSITKTPQIGCIFAPIAVLLIHTPSAHAAHDIVKAKSVVVSRECLHRFFDHSLLFCRVVLPPLEVIHHPASDNQGYP